MSNRWGLRLSPFLKVVMIKVYLKAKTFDELIVKMQMMNTFAGRQYQFNESYYAKNEFYVTFQDSIERWSRISKLVDERIKKSKANKEAK